MADQGVLTKMKKYLFYFILVIFNLFLMELCAYGLGVFAKSYGVFYQEESDFHDYAFYLRYRDPVLGWPLTFPDKRGRDKTGSRLIPAYPDPDRFSSCISLYGDSFTYGLDVDEDHAWSNLLSQLEQCRVANYAEGGYGTDQAYLRFKLNQRDASPIVILGIFSENIMRNVNQFRDLYYPMRYSLKPRFILNRTGDLELVPLPEMSQADYEKLVKDPNSFLPYAYFRVAGPQGPFKLRFPFTISLIKARRHFRITAIIKGRPEWVDFYQENHPAGGLVITAKIAKAFRDLAISRNKQPVIILIPHPADLQYFLKTGVWSYQNLIGRLAQEEVECLNLGPGMLDYLQGRSPYKLFKVLHYNEEGNQVIAGLVDNYLKKKKDAGPRVSIQ